MIGQPFYLISRLDGVVSHNYALPGLAHDAKLAAFAGVARTLAAIHLFDWTGAGLSDFGKPGNYFARQIDGWRSSGSSSASPTIPLSTSSRPSSALNCPRTTGAPRLPMVTIAWPTLFSRPMARCRACSIGIWQQLAIPSPISASACRAGSSHPTRMAASPASISPHSASRARESLSKPIVPQRPRYRGSAGFTWPSRCIMPQSGFRASRCARKRRPARFCRRRRGAGLRKAYAKAGFHAIENWDRLGNAI